MAPSDTTAPADRLDEELDVAARLTPADAERVASVLARPRGEGPKRFFDLTLIGLSAVLVIPLILLIALVVSFTRPPSYLQRHVGAGRRLAAGAGRAARDERREAMA
ncbi:hypothetical protein [Micromonospora sp. DT233]|uniref:hypothetical protein n=1 Tax=Micromonospora sp. DT233 TaxID=3393432 RepID=UPI003CF30DD3